MPSRLLVPKPLAQRLWPSQRLWRCGLQSDDIFGRAQTPASLWAGDTGATGYGTTSVRPYGHLLGNLQPREQALAEDQYLFVFVEVAAFAYKGDKMLWRLAFDQPLPYRIA